MPQRLLNQARLICLGLAVAALGLSTPATSKPADAAVGLPHIEFFFESGCENCARVEDEILPDLENVYGGFYTIAKLDIGNMTNYLRLAGYQARLEHGPDENVSIVVNGRALLSGFSAIRAGLFETMDRALAGELPAVAPVPATLDNLRDRVRKFSLLAVMGAGLVDGLNPCAIATLVFFTSLAVMLKFNGQQLLMAGGAFCVASFLTYFAIGLGLLRVLHLVAGFSTIRAGIDIGMIVLLGLFAALSFRDAWRYRHEGNPNRLSLRLPRPIMLMTHALMRDGLKSRHLVLGGLGIGAAVTALESVCTGQVYVPTLVMVIRGGSSFPRATALLVLYNCLFVLPLIVILWLSWRGLKMAKLLDWSRRHVVFSKCLLGSFFLGLAVLLLLM